MCDSVKPEKCNLNLWRDGGLVLACDRISSMVTFMKVRREGIWQSDLFVDMFFSVCFSLALYIPFSVPRLYLFL